jgi:hypothetical protein
MSSRAAPPASVGKRLREPDRPAIIPGLMATELLRALGSSLRGVMAAVGAWPLTFVASAAAIAVLNVLLPPLVLSLAREPLDYATFNPWLRRLPEYLASSTIPLREKVARLPDLALFWFSADSPYGGTDWGFAVDVRDAARVVLTSALFGAYAALWREGRRLAPRGWARFGRQGGAMGALVSVVSLSTGPCSVMGCGAPVLPVVGLAFAGLSSGTLALLARLSAIATAAVLLALVVAVGYLGWLVDRGRPAPAP